MIWQQIQEPLADSQSKRPTMHWLQGKTGLSKMKIEICVY